MVTKKSNNAATAIVGKKELVDRIYNSKSKSLSLNKSQIEAILAEFLEEVKNSLVNKEEVRFPGYFSLKTFMAKARTAINLKTKEKMVIPAKRRVKFSVSDSLKTAVAK